MASVHVLVRASPHILDVIPKNFGKLPGVDNRCLNCMKEAFKIDPDNTATDGKGIYFTSDSLPGVMALQQQQQRAGCRTTATARMCCPVAAYWCTHSAMRCTAGRLCASVV